MRHTLIRVNVDMQLSNYLPVNGRSSVSFFDSLLFFLDPLLLVFLLRLWCLCLSSDSLSDSGEDEGWEEESWERKESAEWDFLFLLASSTGRKDGRGLQSVLSSPKSIQNRSTAIVEHSFFGAVHNRLRRANANKTGITTLTPGYMPHP